MQDFNLMDFELSGANLIEASAGTGKTYTISALYLRLILEKGLSVSDVLVVTFTRAATAELKQRLRNALVSAQRFIQTQTCDDPTLKDLFDKALDTCGETVFSARVNAALRSFDESAIFTIHGFCQRAIKNNALLANSAFEMELSANADEIYESVIYDYWREHVLPNPEIAKALQAVGMLPETDDRSSFAKKTIWKEAIKQALRGEGVAVDWLTPLNESDIERIQTIFASESMVSYLSSLQSVMDQGGFKKQGTTADPQLFEKSRDAWLQTQIGTPLLKEVEYLSATYYSTLQSKVKKGFAIPECPSECEELEVFWHRSKCLGLETAIGAVRAFYEAVPILYRKAQKAMGVTTFDDMLLTLFDALQAPRGQELADALCRQYKAALIDEFQDTDAIQYGIFRRIFMTSRTEENFVCFVGDPKQSIYRFRGADIRTYLAARDDIGESRRFTLAKNYRSTGALIGTVNELFDSETSFGKKGDIKYASVLCGNSSKNGLMRNGQAMKALAVVTSDEKLSEDMAYDHVAQTIVEYLADETMTIDGERVQAKDMAILVRSQDQVQGMQRQLHRYGVQSRVIARDGIYESEDAKEVESILRAVLDPRHLKTLKTALATRIIGCDALTVYRVGVDEVGAENDRQTLLYWLERFYAYRADWECHGAGFLLSRLLQEHDTVKRFLCEVDGARRLTNVYHLLELLYAMSVEYRLPEALLENFGKMTQKTTDLDEESADALRMESDDNIVTIMTYHKSKGLEFPIVFMPCAFKLMTNQQPHRFNRFEEYENVQGEKCISVAQTKRPDKSSLYHPKDEPILEQFLAEQLRLFYVAVTRASRRLEIIDQPKKNSLSQYLIKGEWTRLIEKGYAESIALKRGSSVKDSKRKEEPIDEQKFKPLAMPPRGRSWSMTSYSQMINQVDRDKDHHDETVTPLNNADVVEALLDVGVGEEDILFFPRGAEAGEALHQIMETIDFTETGKHDELIEQAIERYFPNDEKQTLYRAQAKRMVEALLSAPLDTKWQLKDIACSSRVSELEFLLSMASNDIGPRLVERIRQEDRPGYRLTMSDGEYNNERIQGFLKGFMDLVFEVNGRYFIVDWKSNFLSVKMPEVTQAPLDDFVKANYCQTAMAQAIQSHGYALQYLLYTVALHRMLRVRLGEGYDYERHFGGVYYLFVRGVRSGVMTDDGLCGVWKDRPSLQLIEDLDAILGGKVL